MRYHARKFFDKIARLNQAIDGGGDAAVGARRAKRNIAASAGIKYEGQRPGGMWKAKNNKPSLISISKG